MHIDKMVLAGLRIPRILNNFRKPNSATTFLQACKPYPGGIRDMLDKIGICSDRSTVPKWENFWVYHVGLALEQQGLGQMLYWKNVLREAHSASITERPIFDKIRQRVAQLRAQLTPQNRGVSVAPLASRAHSSAPKDAY